MRIVFFGTPKEAAEILEVLIKDGQNIVGVVSQPDRPKGRGRKIEPTPVKAIARKNEFPVLQPEKLSDSSFKASLKSLDPDIGVVVAFGKIIPKEILDMPKHGLINVHTSLLPKYRGAAPIQWAILNGETETGVTIFKITEQLDTGDMIKQEKIQIDPDDNAKTLSDKIFKLSEKVLLASLKEIKEGKVKFTKQDNSKSSYASKIEKENAVLDWKAPAERISNRIRAMNPHPGAYTFYKKKILKIWQSSIYSENNSTPGTIIELIKQKGFVIATGSGQLLIKEVQPESKKRMSAWDFAIGYHLKIGHTLPC